MMGPFLLLVLVWTNSAASSGHGFDCTVLHDDDLQKHQWKDEDYSDSQI